MTAKIAILIPYFGDWPVWMNFFVESCRWNCDIDWILFTDQAPPENSTANVRYHRISFLDYRDQLSEALGVKVGAEDPYKLCDVRPALGFAHGAMLSGYDFVGFGDLDVIYGDIRSFYDDELLSDFDLLSTHSDRISGHLCLMRNREDIVTAFRKVRGWKDAFRRSDNVTFDERAFFNLFAGRNSRILPSKPPRSIRCFFHEAYSTPAPTTHMRWFWEKGSLTSEYYPHHSFLYLHFMSWHSSRWYAALPEVKPGTDAPWAGLQNVVQMDWRDAAERGFMISPSGIQPIARQTYG
jgi:hypothetical protein